MKRPTIVTVQGNIASGKTTLIRALAKSPKFDCIEEPVEMWQGGFAENMLKLFYKDPKRWAFTFQVMALSTRARAFWQITSTREYLVMERDVYADFFVFARAARANGNMREAEWQLYKRLWTWLVTISCLRPDQILYLYTPAEECLRRLLQERARGEEVGVSLEYLQQLEMYHDDWLRDNPRVIVLDGMEYWPPERLLPILEQA